MVRCITCNVFHMRQLCRFDYCLAWFDTVELNCLPSPNNEMHDDAVFADRFWRQWTMFGIRVLICYLYDYWYVMTSSWPCCIWNRYCQNHRSILPNLLLFAWLDTVEFNRLPCSNNKMYDDVVFDDRFRNQLAMFEVCILIWLYRLLDTHIAYEIAI